MTSMPPNPAELVSSDMLRDQVMAAAHRRWHPLQPSNVFPSFWRFAAERQNIFYNRYYGLPSPWSSDPVLQAYKFTNAYRVTDRVSQFLIRNVIYRGEQSPRELFFRILLFKFFNNINTWLALEDEFGSLHSLAYDVERYDAFLSRLRAAGRTIFSAAYIMPSGSGGYECPRKHRSYLELLSSMLRDRLYDRIADSPSMLTAFNMLRKYPMLGDFLAYQYVTDLNYSILTDHSESQFVVPGPGALRGIHKCFEEFSGLTEADVIRMVADRQGVELDELKVDFKPLFGRKLQYIDVQNLFCEFDKYCRAAFPELSAASGRVRIKQRFRLTSEPIDYFFPPKWRLRQDWVPQQPPEQPTLW